MKRLLLACAFIALPSLAAVGAEVPWAGTWKLDVAKSHQTGEAVSFSKRPDGLIRYSDGTALRYDFRVDGKEYKTYSNRTATWTAVGRHAWNTVIKEDGIVVKEGRRELSPDEKTLTLTIAGRLPDGSPMTNVLTYARASGDSGLLGKWHSTKSEFSAPDIVVISSPSPGVLRVELPTYRYVAEGKTDGTEFSPSGPMVSAGRTTSMKRLSPNKLSYINKLDGKPDSYSIQSIAPDGKSFTEVSWNAGTPSKKTTSVYFKQ